MRDEVFARLLDAIVSGDLEPGEQLHDAEIERWAGASRTPVREALNQLASAGLVEVLPQSKTRVSPIDVEKVLNIVHMLDALYRGVVHDVVPFLTDNDLKELRAYEKDFLRSKKADEFLKDSARNGRLLALFVRRLDNVTVLRLSSRNAPAVRRAINASPMSIDRDLVAEVLREIVSGCESRDPQVAAAAVGRYFEDVVIPLVRAAGTEKKGQA
jgi:DNA-binding GntR family transcriptional regulator